MVKVYDLIIVGAGPAGITAAVYAARKKLNFLVLSADIGGQTAWSGDIENYTGYQFITGPELTLKFQEHMERFGIEVRVPEELKRIEKKEGCIRVVTGTDEYCSRTVIIATGKRPRLLNVPGEKEFKNKGVTYCATCDGPLFKDKSVAVIGGGNSALDAALQMVRLSPKVYVINNTTSLHGDEIMIGKLKSSQNAEIWNNAEVKAIEGDRFVAAVTVEQQGKRVRLPASGVFVEIGLVPNSEAVPFLKRNEAGEIIVDCYNRTNIEGVFAAGDVTNVPEKQIIIACGEGSKASLSAFRYLSTHTF